jgi:murein DD-endopeptidase MepM/ murein hydrolase activator NlpD
MRSRRLLLVALVAMVTMPLTLGGRALAGQTEKQRQLEHDIAETSKAAQQAREQAMQLQAEKVRLDASVGNLSAQVASAQAALAAAEATIERLVFDAHVLSVEIDTTQRKLADAKADAKKSAVLLYQRPDAGSMMSLIGSVDGSGEIVEAEHYLERVSEKRLTDFERAERLRKVLDAQGAELRVQRKEADDARDRAQASKNELERLYAEQQAARAAAATAQAGYDAKVAELSAEQVSLEAEKAAEDAAIRAILASAPPVSDPPPGGGGGGGGGGDGGGGSGGGAPTGTGRFLRPVGGSITSGFGYRSDPVTGGSAFHAGIDFGVGCGTPIRAAGNGTVLSAGWQGGYGNATILNHGGGLATLYGHQSAFAVGAGQAVAAGDVIGYVGSTGKSTGCHLHFEVRENGNPVNPLGYL